MEQQLHKNHVTTEQILKRVQVSKGKEKMYFIDLFCGLAFG